MEKSKQKTGSHCCHLASRIPKREEKKYRKKNTICDIGLWLDVCVCRVHTVKRSAGSTWTHHVPRFSPCQTLSMGSIIRRIFEIKSTVFLFYILRPPTKSKKTNKTFSTSTDNLRLLPSFKICFGPTHTEEDVCQYRRCQLKPGCNSTRRHFKHGGRMTEAREAVKAIKLEMFSF